MIANLRGFKSWRDLNEFCSSWWSLATGRLAGFLFSGRSFHVASLVRHCRGISALRCSVRAQPPSPPPAISYSRDIQPIFTAKCVACHACNDAACQLNLGSAEGVLRGASKVPVYQGDRSVAIAPTRIFYDAQGPEAWRQKGFYRC